MAPDQQGKALNTFMQRGRKAPNPDSKKLSGTYRPGRHADLVIITETVKDAPVAPAYLSEAAKLVWDEEVARVTGCGAGSADSSIFARYCVAEAAFRKQAVSGDVPSAALMTELRRTAELLQIAGAKSRVGKIGGDSKPASPFSVRKR